MAPSQPRTRREGGGLAAMIPGRKEILLGLLSFVGRVLFAFVFLLSLHKDCKEFRPDGWPAFNRLEHKFNIFVKQVSANTGMAVPNIEIQIVFLATYLLRFIGAVLFMLNFSLGAFLLLLYLSFISAVMYDFYNYEKESAHFAQLFTQFSQNLALCGALLFFIAMKNSIPRRYLGNSKRRIAKTKTT